jgi:hypothetical protein
MPGRRGTFYFSRLIGIEDSPDLLFDNPTCRARKKGVRRGTGQKGDILLFQADRHRRQPGLAL